ncbi:MAG TPA: hypothetical protein VEQ61_03605, partial [Thermoleophilaceae bacterium]|nr:hypothetical protein [Thermoleophilaceae bacterium]
MVFVAVIAGRPSTQAGAALPGQRLPDLDAVAPSDLGVVPARVGGERRWRLGFGSAAENVGAGPLIIDGRRSPASRTMVAEQVITRRGGRSLVRPRVGRLRFVTSPDHRHWHLLGFMRYELRHATTYALVRPDRKTGFCLGDRYDAGRSEPRKPRREVFRSDCVPNPDALAV